jgi:hypothetical protein
MSCCYNGDGVCVVHRCHVAAQGSKAGGGHVAACIQAAPAHARPCKGLLAWYDNMHACVCVGPHGKGVRLVVVCWLLEVAAALVAALMLGVLD